jgi:hypothetical protein
MFRITPIPSLPRGSKLLLQGATFGHLNLPIRFSFVSDVVRKPVELSILIIKDDSEKSGIFISDIDLSGEKGVAELRIINPPKGNSTNMGKQQIAMLSEQAIWLGLNFLIAEFSDVRHFLFYYEFYEETIAVKELPVPNQKESTEAQV